MPLLALPEPYDFELSTGRFRAFGLDNKQHAPEWTGEQAADAVIEVR